MGLGAEFVPQPRGRTGGEARPCPAEPAGSSGGIKPPQNPPKTPYGGCPQPSIVQFPPGGGEIWGPGAVAAHSSKGTRSAEYIITRLSASCLQERHLRTLWKEPPAVTKAQRPVQTVMM